MQSLDRETEGCVAGTRPLFPATAEQRRQRVGAMRHVLAEIEKARAGGQRPIAKAIVDGLKSTFSVPVEIGIDWDAVELGHPTILIHHDRADSVMQTLSARQRDVAALVSLGQSNREIAERLGISLATVKDHVHQILTRTGLRSRSALGAAMRR